MDGLAGIRELNEIADKKTIKMPLGILASHAPVDPKNLAPSGSSDGSISAEACLAVARMSCALASARKDGFSVAFSDGAHVQRATGLWVADVRTSSINSRRFGTAVLVRPIESPDDMLRLEPRQVSNAEVPAYSSEALAAMNRIRAALESLADTGHPIFVKCARGKVWNVAGADMMFTFDAQNQEIMVSASRDGNPVGTLAASLLALCP